MITVVFDPTIVNWVVEGMGATVVEVISGPGVVIGTVVRVGVVVV